MKSIKVLRVFNLIFAGLFLAAGFLVLFLWAEKMDQYLKFAPFAIQVLLPLFVAAFSGTPLKKFLENQAEKIRNGGQNGESI